jgi:hypothetical protein
MYKFLNENNFKQLQLNLNADKNVLSFNFKYKITELLCNSLVIAAYLKATSLQISQNIPVISSL